MLVVRYTIMWSHRWLPSVNCISVDANRKTAENARSNAIQRIALGFLSINRFSMFRSYFVLILDSVSFYITSERSRSISSWIFNVNPIKLMKLTERNKYLIKLQMIYLVMWQEWLSIKLLIHMKNNIVKISLRSINK